MSKAWEVLVTLTGAIVVFCFSWAFIGFAARVVKELFCWGYGC